jgi:hypothetical protein
MKAKFSNTEVDIWKLRKGVMVYSENTKKFYYIEGFKYLDDNNPILVLQDCNLDSPWMYISACLLVWLEPH